VLVLGRGHIDNRVVHELQKFSDTLDRVALVIAMSAAFVVLQVAADAVGVCALCTEIRSVGGAVQHARNRDRARKNLCLGPFQSAEQIGIQTRRRRLWPAGRSGNHLHGRIINNAPKGGEEFIHVFIRKGTDIQGCFGVTRNNVGAESAFDDVG